VTPDTPQTILWSRQQSPVTITDTVTVEESQLLVIEPGVTVRFASGIPLIVRGTIRAQGTPSDSILLTAIDGYWGGIQFLGSADTSRIEHATIDHCMEQVVLIRDSSPVISRCRLVNSFTQAETGGQIIRCAGMSVPLIQFCIIAGYSNFHACGVICEPPANPRLVHNDILGDHAAADRCVSGGGFLEGNYLAVSVWNGAESIMVPDVSLGDPVDQHGDDVCSTTSTDTLMLFSDVDGLKEPRDQPNVLTTVARRANRFD
jgi:hypothetical protein